MESVGAKAAWITGWDLRVPRRFVEKCGGKIYKLWRPDKGPRRTRGVVIAWEPSDGDELLFVGRVEDQYGASTEYYILHRAGSDNTIILRKSYVDGKYKLRRVT